MAAHSHHYHHSGIPRFGRIYCLGVFYRVITGYFPEFHPITSNLGQCTVKNTKVVKLRLRCTYPTLLDLTALLKSLTEHIIACTILHDIADQLCNILYRVCNIARACLVEPQYRTSTCKIAHARDIVGATSDEVDDDGNDDDYGSRQQQTRWQWCDGQRHDRMR